MSGRLSGKWRSRGLVRRLLVPVCAWSSPVPRLQVKVRDGQVAKRPVYAVIGVTLDGRKVILGLWAGTGGEGAKFWMSVLPDMKNHGVRDVFFLVCDGLKGLPAVVSNVCPQHRPDLHHPPGL